MPPKPKRTPIKRLLSCFRMDRLLVQLLALVAISGGVGCQCSSKRQACERDLDCQSTELCMPDSRCLPLDVAKRSTPSPGTACHVHEGADTGCEGEAVCRFGYCLVPGQAIPGTTTATDDGGETLPVGDCQGQPGNELPLFGGGTATADGPDAAMVRWSPAADETAHSAMAYLVYMAQGSNPFDLSQPVATVSGQVEFRQSGLEEGQTYRFWVRAKDEAGQLDCNENVTSVTPQGLSSCIDYETGVKPIFQASCVRCHSGASPPQNLLLDSRDGVLAGGRTGNEVVKCKPDDSLLYHKVASNTPPVGVRMPFDGPPYLSDFQIETIRRWIAEGARLTCAEADPCADAVPPTFAGVTSVTTHNATSAKVCWSAGSDDLTASLELVYDLYFSSTSGGQSFDKPSQSSTAGETCVTVDALPPGEQACFVTRARDGAGNRDSNAIEKCVTLPALPAGCVDYTTMVEPILNRNCVRCHSGKLAPQSLELDSYAHVIAGSVRRREVLACNAAGSLLIQKVSTNPPLGKRMPLDGPPYLANSQIALLSQWINNGAPQRCDAVASCSDISAPTFSGVKTATVVDPTTARVCWDPATDNSTPATSLRYDIFEAATSGGFTFTNPAAHSAVGETCRDIRVAPGASICFAVRAVDLLGRTDANSQEACLTMPTAACAVEFSSHIQPILASRCTHCHNAKTPPRFLDLSNYGKVLAGGSIRREVESCNPSSSLLIQKMTSAVCGRRMPFDGAPYLSPSQMSLMTHWIQSGARERCSDQNPCSDVTPPTFAGATSVTPVDASTAKLCWSAATDSVSSSSSITYEVYESIGNGGQRFTAPASHAAAAGSTCIDLPVPPNATTCYVVRAKDLRGNRDSNTNERCLTIGATCVDYHTRVQTIFDQRCIQCHSGSNPPKDIRWDSYVHARANDEVSACDPGGSKMLDVVSACEMPYDTSADRCATPACLTPTQIRFLREWVVQGANETCSGPGC